MTAADARLVAGGVVAVLLGWFALANRQDVRVHFWLVSATAPVVVVVAIAGVCGAALGALAAAAHLGPPPPPGDMRTPSATQLERPTARPGARPLVECAFLSCILVGVRRGTSVIGPPLSAARLCARMKEARGGPFDVQRRGKREMRPSAAL